MGYSLPGSGGSTPADLLSSLLYPEIAVSGAGALTLGHMHVCSGAAGYTVTLPPPAGNAGKLLGVRMDPALVGVVTLDAGAGVGIDGPQTRIMWANESALLLCNGTNWVKMGGKSIPMISAIAMNGNQTFAVATATMLTFNTDLYNHAPASMQDLANNRLMILRPGRYTVTLEGTTNNTNATGGMTDLNLFKNGGILSQDNKYTQPAAYQSLLTTPDVYLLACDYLQVYGSY
jgi:hypothetical protein